MHFITLCSHCFQENTTNEHLLKLKPKKRTFGKATGLSPNWVKLGLPDKVRKSFQFSKTILSYKSLEQPPSLG